MNESSDFRFRLPSSQHGLKCIPPLLYSSGHLCRSGARGGMIGVHPSLRRQDRATRVRGPQGFDLCSLPGAKISSYLHSPSQSWTHDCLLNRNDRFSTQKSRCFTPNTGSERAKDLRKITLIATVERHLQVTDRNKMRSMGRVRSDATVLNALFAGFLANSILQKASAGRNHGPGITATSPSWIRLRVSFPTRGHATLKSLLKNLFVFRPLCKASHQVLNKPHSIFTAPL